jgi:hypothetical protein
MLGAASSYDEIFIVITSAPHNALAAFPSLDGCHASAAERWIKKSVAAI